jgi:hypothetical protein
LRLCLSVWNAAGDKLGRRPSPDVPDATEGGEAFGSGAARVWVEPDKAPGVWKASRGRASAGGLWNDRTTAPSPLPGFV